MSRTKTLWGLVSLVALFFAIAPAFVQAQVTSATAAVTGTAFDKTGAVVPKASVELRDVATNAARTTTTNQLGQYSFATIQPGTYRLTVTAPGFRRSVVGGLKVDVGKSTLVNVTLELGEVSQVIEVQAGAGTELQTMDASVGNLLDRRMLDNLPSLRRDVTEVLLFQPMTAPGFNNYTLGGGELDCAGGQVAGARSDQNTFLLDGGDVTDNMAGSGQYSGTSFHATPRPTVPIPVESLEEFRVTTNNPNASFSRASGGQVEMVTRRGTNAWHGAGYDWLQNNHLNANSWLRNRLSRPNPVLRDNRFGGRLGGPIWKDKAYFFVHYEGRRFFLPADISRLVPTESLKAGILRFKDATGAVRDYNLNSVATVDPVTGQTVQPSGLDPRGLGLNPVVAKVWALEPKGNDPTFGGGDNLNTIGFTGPGATLIRENFGVARFDYKISDKWQWMSSYRYAITEQNALIQVDIGGALPGDKLGTVSPTSQRPLAPRYLVTGLTGQITPHLTSDFRFDWLRNWWGWGVAHPLPQNQGLTTSDSTQALSIAGKGDSASQQLIPINFDVQNSRSRTWTGNDYTFVENLSWLKGTHTVQFGGRVETQRFIHVRDDKVLGALIYPFISVGQIQPGGNITVSGAGFAPPSCSSTVTTNCLVGSSNVKRWDNYYSMILGMVDRGAALLTRAADFSPNPPLTNLDQHSIVDSYQLYFSDAWRIKSSFTLSYGLTWGVQMPPFEQNGKQTILIDHNTGLPITTTTYFPARKAAALQGQVYNPQLDIVPIRNTSFKYPYETDWSNFAPRLAAAWNPSATSGIFGKLFGDRKTVLRSGLARVYDRVNGVGIVLLPSLSAGFGTAVSCKGPRSPITSTGGCAGGSKTTDPNTAFRIGPQADGTTVPLPTLKTITPPAVPGVNSPFELLDFRIDPKRKVGYSDSWDVTIQRELPGSMILEVGYVGRYSHRLYQGVALNHVPYMMRAGGESFAQAFTAVRKYLEVNGTTKAVVAAIPPTVAPWFDAMLSASGGCAGFASCAGAVINGSAFGTGTDAFLNANVFDVWTTIDGSFPGNLGNPNPANFGPGSAGGADTNQVLAPFFITSAGRANYNAGFLTLRKRTTHGLAFDVNYTYSHANDVIGVNQESDIENSDAFNINRDYGPSAFDRRHIFNTLVTYDLPFGRGRRFSSSSGVLNKIIGGWTISGIFVWATGIPQPVFNSNSCEEFGADLFFGNCAAYAPTPGAPSSGFLTATPNRGVTGSGGCGTSGNVNAFADPGAVCNNVRVPDIASSDRATFEGSNIRSFHRWNLDLGVAKTTKVTERVSVRFDAHMTNVFNHPLLASFIGSQSNNDVLMDLATPETFGVLGAQYNQPRFIQVGLHIEF